ncbi:MAG: formylglycine-generating enzyme family protein [Gammaproteobacteria bacterium]
MKPAAAAVMVATVAAVAVVAAAALRRAGAEEDMAHIPAGEYLPLYAESDADGRPAETKTKRVAGFYLDRDAVSNGEFLEFVKQHPRWQKSRAPALFADGNYLAHWRGDLSPGENMSAPAVNISWFAARAYCRWRGKILPSVAQWEYAAMADETSPFAARDNRAFRERIMQWYAGPAGIAPEKPGEKFENIHGVRGMHGVVWEWTRDFNNALVTGASRSDSSASRNLFCGGGALGASDFSDYAAFMRFAFRSSLNGNYAVSSLGFRCAREAGLDA